MRRGRVVTFEQGGSKSPYSVDTPTAGLGLAFEDSQKEADSDHEDALPVGMRRPLPPLLYELHTVPPQRATTQGRRYLNKEERRYIAYRLAECESCRAIGVTLGVPEATVRSFQRRVRNNAALLLDCEFSIAIDVGHNHAERWYLCRYCCDLHKTAMGAGRHAVEHLR